MSSNKNSRSSYHGPRGRRDKDHTSKRLHFDYDRPKRKPSPLLYSIPVLFLNRKEPQKHLPARHLKLLLSY